MFDYTAPYADTTILAAIAETGESQLGEGSEAGFFKFLIEPDQTVVVRSELDVAFTKEYRYEFQLLEADMSQPFVTAVIEIDDELYTYEEIIEDLTIDLPETIEVQEAVIMI